MSGLSDEQIQKHRATITGSKVASILKIKDAYMSKFTLFNLMKGFQAWPELEGERLKAGTYMEKGIHAWCEGEYGWDLAEGPEEGKFHQEHDFLYGLIDRLKIEGGEPGAVVEFKNVDSFMKKHWEDGPPDKFRAQVYFYNLLWDLPTAWIVACFGGNHFEKYEVPRNPKIEKFILDKCLEFWDDLQNERWPEPDGTDDCAKTLSLLFNEHDEKMAEGPIEVLDIAREYKSLSAQIKELEGKKDLYANQLKNAIGSNQGLLFPDGSKATWKMTSPKKVKFNEGLFEKENPKLYKRYASLPPEYRRLNVSVKETI
jgi:predicted phage-related endonuclease